MQRAKFETLEKQREFFIEVKKKLGVGAKNLSKMVGLKSRGNIESYTFMRTAPPTKIVKKLEEISGIKANYETVDGKIYRLKRGFIPLDSKDAENILRKKFGKDFKYLNKIIKTDLTIAEIVNNIRKKGYSFNNSIISRCVGAYRTNLLIEIVEEIKPAKEDIIVKGYVSRGKLTLEITFHLAPLQKIIRKNKIRVGLKISKDRKRIKLIPLNYGRHLIKSGNSIRVLITAKSELKKKSNVEIIFNPKNFGFTITDSLYDKDSKELVKYALKEGFSLDQHRLTPKDYKGDLSLYRDKENFIIEVTKAISSSSCYFKVGQLFIQKYSWPKATHILICKENLLSGNVISALKKLGVRIIYSNFEKGWERKVIEKIKNESK